MEKLGATGDFPKGKLNEDDEGELRMAVMINLNENLVKIHFGKPVTWLGLPKKEAMDLGRTLIKNAERLRDEDGTT